MSSILKPRGLGILADHLALAKLAFAEAGHTGFQQVTWISLGPPDFNNDSVDTAAIGRTFAAGDLWIDTATPALYSCSDATPTAAVWTLAGAAGAAAAGRYTFPAANILTDIDPDLGAKNSGVLCTDGQDIDQLADQSAAGNDATAGSNYPTFRAGALNGYGVAEFQAALATRISFGVALGRPANYSIYAVVRMAGTARARIMGSLDAAASSTKSWGVLDYGGTAYGLQTTFGDDSVYSVTKLTINEIPPFQWMILSTVYSAGSNYAELWFNGKLCAITKTTTNAIANSGVAQNYTLGRMGDYNGNYFTGELGRFAAYEAAHSAATVRTIHAGLASQYSIAGAA